MFETGTATDYLDLLDKLDTFLTATGSAYGLTATGVGNGTLTLYKGGTASIAEFFEITATDPTHFIVEGSTSGEIGTAVVGTPFSHNKLAFLITAGGTAFQAGDKFTLSTAPKWTRLRKAKGCRISSSHYGSGYYAAENVIDGKHEYSQLKTWDVAPANATEWIQFDFLEAETIREWAIMLGMDIPSRVTLERWNGSAWQTLDDRTGVAGSGGEWKTYTIASPVSATRLRVVFYSQYGEVGIAAVELRRQAGEFAASVGQWIWKAPGNDGNSEIFVGIHHLARLDVDYFDWELASFDGFDAVAPFHSQVGYEGRLYLALWNQAIDYWFVADGRHVKIVAKINAQYEVGILGFGYDPYFSPNQLPYPALLGGTVAIGDPYSLNSQVDWSNPALRWSDSSTQHRSPTHSDIYLNNYGSQSLKWAQLRLRRLDGVWIPLEATSNDSPIYSPQSSQSVIWPYCSNFTKFDVNLDGSYALLPIVLCTSGPNTYGQLSGIKALTGQGLTAETLVRLGAIDYLVLPNISRTHLNDFLAVALD